MYGVNNRKKWDTRVKGALMSSVFCKSKTVLKVKLRSMDKIC